MSKSTSKNKLARCKLANTASSSRTQLIVTQEEEVGQKQQQRGMPISSPSDTQVEATKDSSLLSFDDLILSQNYNPNSDVAWQVASPEVLRRIHKAITKNQRFRSNRHKAKDGNDTQLATIETKLNSPAVVKPKKRSKMKKRFNSNIENIIKTIEMKIKSDEYLANSGLSSQRNPTQSNNRALCLEACHFDNCECDSISNNCTGTKQTSLNNLVEPISPSLESDCKNDEEKVSWSEDELLNDSLLETGYSDNCVDSIKEKSSVTNTNSSTNQNDKTKLLSPIIQNNLKYSNLSSSKKNNKSLHKRKTLSSCKNKKVNLSESMSSSSDDMNLSDSEIDEMLSQLQETDLFGLEMAKNTMNNAKSEILPAASPSSSYPIALNTEQFSNNRITRQMAKIANVQVVENQTKFVDIVTNHSELTKPYFLRSSSSKKTNNNANSKVPIPGTNPWQSVQTFPKCNEDLFEDSEITDELLVDIYEDLFKDDMQEDDGSITNQKK